MTKSSRTADLPLNQERAAGGSIDVIAPLTLGEIERRQREAGPPWGGTVAEDVEIVSVELRSGGVRSARSAADVESDTAAWASALATAGVVAGAPCATLLPPGGEGLGDLVRCGLTRLEAQVRDLPSDLTRLVIAELRQQPARVLLTSRTVVLALQSTVYAEFPLEPADLGVDRIVLVGETAVAGEVRRLVEEFEASLAQIATGPLGQPIGVSQAAGAFAVAEQVQLRCWDGDGYADGVPGDLVMTVAHCEAMPIANLAVGLRGTVAGDGTFTLTGEVSPGLGRLGHRLIVDEAVQRTMRLVPGVADWRLGVARPGREDVATLQIHADRDDGEPVARNARKELAERLGLGVEVVVEPAGTDAAYENGIIAEPGGS